MRDRLVAVRFERASEHQRIHPDARQRAAVDINRVNAPIRHHVAHLLEDAFGGNSLRRINFDRHDKFSRLNLFPELALGLARENSARHVHGSYGANGCGRFVLRREKLLCCVCHCADVLWRSAAATTEQPYADLGSLARKQRKVFGR